MKKIQAHSADAGSLQRMRTGSHFICSHLICFWHFLLSAIFLTTVPFVHWSLGQR